MDYQKQAENFLKKAKATIKIELSKQQQTPLWHKEGQDYGLMYNITIEREGKTPWIFNFWDSIANKEEIEKASKDYSGKLIYNKKSVYPYDYVYLLAKRLLKKRIEAGEFKPTNYDILACLTKYDPEDFENFCFSFGYDEDSKTAEKTFLAVNKEWHAVNNMFSDLLEELQEIN